MLFRQIKERALVRTKIQSKDGRYSAKKTEQLSLRGCVHFFFTQYQIDVNCCEKTYQKSASFITHRLRHHGELPLMKTHVFLDFAGELYGQNSAIIKSQ